MKTKIILMIAAAALIVSSSIPAPVYAGEVDILVRKLVEKGVLTAGEAQQIITETKEEVKLELAKGQSPSVPKWVQNIKLKGDLRTRYQWERMKGSSSSRTAAKDRARVRFRLGMDSKVNDKVSVGAGVATGSTSDPRSTNQTLESSFPKVNLNLDYGYAEYTPYTWLSTIGGIFKKDSYLWAPSDLLWDTDINPAGAAAHFGFKPYDHFNVWGNVLYGSLSRQGSDSGYPWMYALQPGFDWKILPNAPDKISLKGAFTYYDFEGLDNVQVGTGFYNSEGTNTSVSQASARAYGKVPGTYLYDYDTYALSGQVDIKDPLGSLSIPHIEIPYLGIFGDYVYNPDPDDDGTGWLIGAAFGHKKIATKGQWQVAYNYRRMEKDAWLDFLSDSDFYGGGDTNAKGHEFIFQYGLLDNVTFGFDWYHGRPISAPTSGPLRVEDLIQCDVQFKF